jgi:hypothetical protein
MSAPPLVPPEPTDATMNQSSTQAGAPASTPSSSVAALDTLPPTLDALLKQISAESRRADGWVQTQEQKEHIQQQLREHAKAQAERMIAQGTTTSQADMQQGEPMAMHIYPPTPQNASSSLASLSFASLDSIPAFTPADASAASSSIDHSLAPTPLFRHLSDAAAAGLITHEFKTQLKSMLLNNKISALSSTRLVRQVSEEGVVSVTQEKLDLSGLDEDTCVALQQEERDAITAIYEELVTFKVTTEAVDAEEEEEEEGQLEEERKEDAEEDEEETKEPEYDENGAESQQCINVTVEILPYPSQAERNKVTAVMRFKLPPLYPYIRPGVELLSVHGMSESDGMMCGTAINECLNDLFAIEPVPEQDVRVVLFDLIQAGQNFLCEYVEFLEDAEYHAQLAADNAALAAKEKALLEAKEYEVRHAQEVYAYLMSDHKTKEWGNYSISTQVQKDPIAEAARLAALKKAEEERLAKIEAARLSAELELKRKLAEEEAMRVEFLKKSADSTAGFAAIMPAPYQMLDHMKRTDPNMRAYATAFAKGDVKFENIASPFLIYRFMKKREAMARAGRDISVSYGFHGTLPAYVDSIAKNGLIVPGSKIDASGKVLAHRCDVGFYGKG